MRILFDIVHPAHVHFFKHMVRALQQRGHVTRIVARHKEVTTELLDHEGLDYTVVGRAAKRSLVGHLGELVRRDIALAREAAKFDIDVILTRNPAGVQAARLCGALGVFDTDDGSAVGVHFHAARPFAHLITSPDCLWEDFGRRHITYPGYKQTAYLHPDHFSPDPGVRRELGVAEGHPYFIVRFVAMAASHDRKEEGLSDDLKARIVDLLSRRGRVFVTSEAPLPGRWERYRLPIRPHRLHDALAFADLLVGDSQTMAAEAAVLGTPAVWVASFAGRVPYLEELERRYGLVHAFRPHDTTAIMERLERLIEGYDVTEQRDRLLRDKCNVARWYVDRMEQEWAT